MKYFSWLWNNSRGIRWNTMVRIVTGIGQVVLGLHHVLPEAQAIGAEDGGGEPGVEPPIVIKSTSRPSIFVV
jgi:hypothetical protein